MAMGVLGALAQNRDLVDRFRADPLAGLKELEDRTGRRFAHVQPRDLDALRNFTTDDFEVMLNLAAKAGGKNTTPGP